MSLKARVAGGLKWQAVMVIGRQLLSLVIFTILTRLLGPEEFGLMGLTFVYLTIAGFLADQGLGSAIIQRANLQTAHLHSAFWFTLGCAGLLCGGTLIFAGPLADLFNEPRLAALLQWTSLSLVLSATVAVQNALFTRELDFRRPAIRNLVGQIAGGAVGIGMALTGWGVWALVGQQLGVSLVGALLLAAMSPYRPAWQFSPARLYELLRVSFPLLMNWLVGFMGSRMDQIIIGRVLGASPLGLYVVAARIPELLRQSSVQAIADVSMPALSKLQHDHAQMREAIYHGMGINALVMFAVFVGLAATASDFVPLFFGEQWIAAVPICTLLSLYALLQALQVLKSPALVAAGITSHYLVLNTVTLGANLIAGVIGVRFGVVQVVVGLILVNLMMVFPWLLLLKRRIGLDPIGYWKPCGIPALAAIAMVGAIWLTSLAFSGTGPTWTQFIVKVAVGASVYLGCNYLLNRSRLVELLVTVHQTLFPDRKLAAAR
jgi:O-antigen/teichoic acid export membrane protein